MSKVKFAAFFLDGRWRLEETRENVFHWLRTRNHEMPKNLQYDRIYRLRDDRDLDVAAWTLRRVMIHRYGIEPVRPW